MNLPEGKRRCKLYDVLFVPGLSYNLLSISKVSKMGKVAKFSESGCQITNSENKLIACMSKCGSLYFLECESRDQANTTLTSEEVWHRRYGHLEVQGLKQLAVDGLVNGFDYDSSKGLSFVNHVPRTSTIGVPFLETAEDVQRNRWISFIYTDVCGKLNAKSLGGAEYFLTFIDDKTRFTWVYLLKRNDEVFQRFVEWKAMVENSGGGKLKVLRSDNGGEYTAKRFQEYLKAEGVRHELTVPKTPQQNGVAECLNCTLVEMVRTMLIESNLDQRFRGEAMSTAVYLRNRSPTKAVIGMTPHEALYGEKPNVRHL